MEVLKSFFKPTKEPDMPVGNLDEMEKHFLRPEKEDGLEEIKRNYAEAIKSREDQYNLDLAAKLEAEPEAKREKENQRSVLDTHNNIVLGYADELVKAHHNLSEEDKVAAYLAVIFHDSGKLASGLLEHHIKGVEYAWQRLDELEPIKQGGETIEITPELKEKILDAVERHMNHPFLVNLNKGRRFAEPENDIDKIVNDADMMANVGFKNVCFRLSSKKYFNEDIAKAFDKTIPALEETFNNVMSDVTILYGAVKSNPAENKIKFLISEAVRIFNYLKENQIFQKIQDEYSKDHEFDFKPVDPKPVDAPVLDVPEIKVKLNAAIREAAGALKIDVRVARNFVM